MIQGFLTLVNILVLVLGFFMVARGFIAGPDTKWDLVVMGAVIACIAEVSRMQLMNGPSAHKATRLSFRIFCVIGNLALIVMGCLSVVAAKKSPYGDIISVVATFVMFAALCNLKFPYGLRKR